MRRFNNAVLLYFVCVGWGCLGWSASCSAKPEILKPNQSNVIYGMVHGAALLLDVYQPETSNGYALVFTMGTGFTAQGEYDDIPLKQLDSHLLQASIFPNFMGEQRQMFAAAYDAGFTVFSINHRLAPEHRWQQQLSDVQRAIQYIRANASKYNVNATWIAGMGHSSGASLIALAATYDDIAQLNAHDPIARVSSKLQAVVPISGVYDLLAARQQIPGITSMLDGYIGQTITYQPEGHPVFQRFKQASPVHQLDKTDPPMFLIHGVEDDVVSVKQSSAMYEAVKKHEIRAEFLAVPYTDHGTTYQDINYLPMQKAADWLQKQLPR